VSFSLRINSFLFVGTEVSVAIQQRSRTMEADRRNGERIFCGIYWFSAPFQCPFQRVQTPHWC